MLMDALTLEYLAKLVDPHPQLTSGSYLESYDSILIKEVWEIACVGLLGGCRVHGGALLGTGSSGALESELE